ncbi:MAG: hypothetical protein AB1791_18015 [Chloroflexota bacterium]
MTVLIQHPPKMVYDNDGRLIEVILAAEDFRAYLRSLAGQTDWAKLPTYLQDAIDRMLIDEVRHEKEAAFDLEVVLSGVGIVG